MPKFNELKARLKIFSDDLEKVDRKWEIVNQILQRQGKDGGDGKAAADITGAVSDIKDIKTAKERGEVLPPPSPVLPSGTAPLWSQHDHHYLSDDATQPVGPRPQDPSPRVQ